MPRSLDSLIDKYRARLTDEQRTIADNEIARLVAEVDQEHARLRDTGQLGTYDADGNEI